MKNKLSLLFLFGFISLIATAEPEPAPPPFERSEDASEEISGSVEDKDAFDPDARRPKLTQIQVEFVELSQEKLTELLFLRSPKSSDATDLRKQVQDLVSKKEAKVLETQIVTCKSGQKATATSNHEFMYPTEYEMQMTPEKLSKELTERIKEIGSFCANPATPTAFDTRNLGGNLEVEPTISWGDRVIDLRFTPEFIWHTGNTTWRESKDSKDNLLKISMPDFYIVRIETAINCIDGQYTFVGAVSPKNDEGETDTSRKLMVFVKCDILTVK